MYISGHRQHSLTTSGQPTLYGVTHYIYMVFMETYMPNVEWHIVITQGHYHHSTAIIATSTTANNYDNIITID